MILNITSTIAIETPTEIPAGTISGALFQNLTYIGELVFDYFLPSKVMKTMKI